MDCFLLPLFLRLKKRVREEPYQCQTEARVDNIWKHGASRRLRTLIETAERECQGERSGQSAKARMFIHAIDKTRSKFHVQETISMPSVMSSDDSHMIVRTQPGFLKRSECLSRPWRSFDDIPSSAETFADREKLACITTSAGKELRQKQTDGAVSMLLSVKDGEGLQTPNKGGDDSRFLTHAAMENEEFLQSQKETKESEQMSPETEKHEHMQTEINKLNEMLAEFEESKHAYMKMNGLDQFRTDPICGSEPLSNSEGESVCHEQMSTREEKRWMATFLKESETFTISTQGNELESSGTGDSDEVWNENEFHRGVRCTKTNTLSEMQTKENAFKGSTTEEDIPNEFHDEKLSEVTECNTPPVFKMKTSKSLKDPPNLPNLMHHDDEHIYAQIPCRTTVSTTQDFPKPFITATDDSRYVESKLYRPKRLGNGEENLKLKAKECLEGQIKSPNGTEQLLIRDEIEPLYSSVPCRPQEGNLKGICMEPDHEAPTKAVEGNTCFGFTAKTNTGIWQENSLKVQSGVKQRVPRDDEPIYSQLPCRQITLSQPLKIPNCVDKIANCDDEPIYAKVPVPCVPPVSMSQSLTEVPCKTLSKTGDWEKGTTITSNILADGEISRRLTRGDIAYSQEEPAFPGKNVLGDTKLTFQPKKVQVPTVVVDSAYQKYLQDIMNSF